MIRFSIIIPHKNSPALLQKCLDSIPAWDSIQVIVVDDNSDSSIVDFKRFPFWKGKHFRVIYDKKGKGAGYARNVGLQCAEGYWVLFSDADDFFLDSFPEVLSWVRDDSTDVIYFDATAVRVDNSGHSSRVDHLNRMQHLYNDNPEKALLQFRYLFGEPWCKLIRRDLIESRHITFDETVIHNDTTFSYLVGFFAETIVVNPAKIYCVTDSPGSVSNNTAKEVHYIRTMVFAKKNLFLYRQGIPMFDPLFMRPFFESFRRKDWLCLFRCLLIARRYGYSMIGVLMRMYTPKRLKWLINHGFERRLKYSFDA